MKLKTFRGKPCSFPKVIVLLSCASIFSAFRGKTARAAVCALEQSHLSKYSLCCVMYEFKATLSTSSKKRNSILKFFISELVHFVEVITNG